MKKIFVAVFLLFASASLMGFTADFENKLIENRTEYSQNTILPVLPGVFRYVNAPASVNGSENLGNLFDGDSKTKYLTNPPANITLSLKQPFALTRYSMTSANDYENRDPFSWTLEGSADGENWTLLQKVKEHIFERRYQTAEFALDNRTEYLYYRLSDIQTRSAVPDAYLQLAELTLDIPEGDTETEAPSGMLTQKTGGPDAPWTGIPGRGWTDSTCLEITGTHSAGTSGKCVNVIFDNLNYKIKKNTVFEFCILPMYIGEYDFSHANKYVSLDLRFSDGTLLSETGVADQDGFGMGAWNQGHEKRTYTGQWNYISCDLSRFAGRTVSEILAVYDQREGAAKNAGFQVYVSDVKISEKEPVKRETPADYVDTRRGTNDSFTYSRGLTYPAVCLPNAFTAWTPSTTQGDRRIYAYQPGHKITHFMSGHAVNYCLGDHGNFMVMPNSDIDPGSASSEAVNAWNRGSGYDKASERAAAHGYTVTLNRGNIRAEIAPTLRCGTMRFTFPEDAEHVNIILDSMNGEVPAHGRIAFNADGSFDAFTDMYSDQGRGMPGLYVHGIFSVKPSAGRKLSADTPLSIVSFPKGTREVVVNMGTSYISCEQAAKNLRTEIGSQSFDTVRNSAKSVWNSLLSRVMIDIKGENITENYLVTFYSSMYRLFRFPTVLTENTGTENKPHLQYTSPYSSGIDKPSVKDGDMHTSNGFWDNYRTTWPAYALLAPEKDTKALNGILAHYRETGWLAKWLCPRGIDCMVGSSSDIILAEAMVKGIDFDRETAYECALKNATVVPPAAMGRAGMDFYPYIGHTAGHGYSWMIEDCINDYGISRMAQILGHRDEAAYFARTAAFYSNMFNSDIEFFVFRNKDGSWQRTRDNFDPYWWHDGYAESNAWGASVSAVHDGEGLAGLYGGREGLQKRLDDIFAADCHYSSPILTHENYEARDLRMGQYQHNNQPSQHIPYMYAYTDAKYRTQELTREILRRLFIGGDFGQGYTGDEDNGEQSGWFVLSSLGFYALNPGSGEYVITSPLFDRVTLNIPSGRIIIEARNNSRDNCYIQSLTIDGRPWNSVTIPHSTLIKAKHIVFVMGPKPSDWAKGTYPVSITEAGQKPRPWTDITGTIPGREFLTDNTSDTAGMVNEPVIIECDRPAAAELLTICCGDRTKAPKAFALYGSADGRDWTLIEKRDNIKYMWDRQLKPFIVHQKGQYRYYKLDTRGEIAQLELLK